MIQKVKLALRISTNAFDTELADLIESACADLYESAGIIDPYTGAAPLSGTQDALIRRAIITYCKLHFGEPADPERLKQSYDEQKAQMQLNSTYQREGWCC